MNALRSMLILAPMLLGCTTTAQVAHWQPSELAVDSVGKVAVLAVAGPRDYASTATQRLVEQLNERSTGHIIGPGALQEVSDKPLFFGNGRPNVAAALDAARAAGADSLLVPELHFREPDGRAYGTRRVYFGDPHVFAVLSFRMIDVATQTLVEQDEVRSAEYAGEISRLPGSENAEVDILTGLAEEASSQLAAKLVPHQSVEDVTLAGGWSWTLQRGNWYAQRGQWDRARSVWERCVDQGRARDAALYNLGLACETAGDLAQAREYYERALASNDRPMYRDRLARWDELAQNHQLALAQRHAPPPPFRSSGPVATVASSTSVTSWPSTMERAADRDSQPLRKLPPVPVGHWPE